MTPAPQYVVRGAGAAPSAIRQLVRSVDPSRVVFGMKTLQTAVDADLERPRANARMVTVGGIVLCGGQSQRMGQPKAWLPFGGELMLPRIVRPIADMSVAAGG